MIPNTIAGIAANHVRLEGSDARASRRRVSRVLAGGPHPEK